MDRTSVRVTRDGLLFGVGLLMLVSQTVAVLFHQTADVQIVTAGTAIVLAPAVLHSGDRRKDQNEVGSNDPDTAK